MMKLIRTLAIMVLLLPCIVNAVTHIVDIDGSGQYTSIQAALDASASGDTVLVYPGRYFENLVIQTNNISLASMEAITSNPVYIDSTIIDGSMTNPCLRVSNGKIGIAIQGLSLTNGMNIGSGGGLLLSSGSISSMINCKVFNNIANNGGGINTIGATAFLSGVEVYNNYSVNYGGGLYGSGITNYNVNISFDPMNRCSIYNNRSGSGQDIYIQEATSNLNVYLDTFSVAVPSTYYAIYLSHNDAGYEMNLVIQNAHHQEINQDIYVSPNGNDSNDGLSPDTPLKTIHEGIYRIAADSLNQKTVHLLPGTYSRIENDQIFPIALKSWVKVQGSGMDSTEVIVEPHPTIPLASSFTDTAFRTPEKYMTSIFDFSITAQNTDNACAIIGLRSIPLNISNIRIHDIIPDYVAAVYVWLGIEYDNAWDNVIIENIVTPKGGMLSINGKMSGTISNSKFRNATSTFVSASVAGPALVSISGDRSLRFENCEFSNLTMSDDDSAIISIGGIQFPQQSNNFSFVNCLFSNNTSNEEMIYVGSRNYPNIDFTNCTFAGNESDSYTLMVNGNVNINNSIFYNDSPYQIKVNPMPQSGELTTLNIDYANIKDGIAGIQQAPGNSINYLPTSISSNPFFMGGDDIHDPLYYSLSAGSPCINSGTPDTTGLGLLPYDLAGNWRIWDGRIDMGCYEYDSVPWVANDDPVVPLPEQLMLYQNYPNPFNPTTTISYQLPQRGKVKLDVYNLKGQHVKNLVSESLGEGLHQAIWNGTDTYNQNVASGVYLYRLSIDGTSQSKKMLLMK